jgi:hypothetical protein
VKKALALLSLAALVPFHQALADSPAPTTAATATTVLAQKDEAPRFWGFSFDYSLYDGTGLNATNYTNSITQYFEPAWSPGKLWLRGTRFKTLTLAGRFALTRALAGYDDANFSQYSDNGYAVRCSNLQVSSTGTVDPNAVQRCQYSANYRWDYGDIWLTVKNPKIVTIPFLKVDINPSLRFILPTSLESQYQTLRLATAYSLGATRTFWKDKITLGYSFGFTKYFHQYTTPGESTSGAPLKNDLVAAGYGASDIAPSTANFLSDPSKVGTINGLNPDFGFTHIFSVDVAPIDKLNFTLLYLLIDAYSYPATCDPINVAGVGLVNDCANANTVAKVSNGVGTAGRQIKDSQVLWVTVGYQVTDYLNLSLAWINWAPLRKPDNSYRQGIISTNYDAFTTVNFGATLSIEKVAAKLF